MADTRCVADRLSEPERAVLRAYVDKDEDWLLAADRMVEWVDDVVEMLVARGFLQRHERGILVTPEGVAASLS